jgi:transposase
MKYIKANFADSRLFSDIEDWNQRTWQWLKRTNNQIVHKTTKKRPVVSVSYRKATLTTGLFTTFI